ncbi:lipoprotein insertase outer membrane protein LolB [Klebsiella sp. WP4-W18-ESBL-05]|uniref:lipoprotein insertase outer membrane protein LolB n=1 Tax=Enterobacteriaceae TaxID=543 RepID=UPI0015DBFDAF|nr:lipoprotein insertase outer membrane protein LolB [Klebsiella sp. WP4-W18-ESBL-05]BBR59185.1 outer-membrane lipoprotein LolB [Klebsiella sp. WP4-W18-ESBL-05]HAT3953544.1 lipoprotein localization protein LolB [Kluyvera ascorbata]
MALPRLIRLLPLAALVLTACTVNPPKGPGKSPTSPQWQQHQQEVRQLSQYQTRGAFAYLSDQQKVYARFFWQQTGQDNYRLLLTNPLGSTEMELIGRPGSAQLTDNKGQRYTDTDGEEMVGKLTGMPIPLNSLRQWILGLPGNATDYTLDDQYRLSELHYTENGKTWKVVYSGYDSKTQPALPSNMELTEGSQRIKLRMDNWIVR